MFKKPMRLEKWIAYDGVLGIDIAEAAHDAGFGAETGEHTEPHAFAAETPAMQSDPSAGGPMSRAGIAPLSIVASDYAEIGFDQQGEQEINLTYATKVAYDGTRPNLPFWGSSYTDGAFVFQVHKPVDWGVYFVFTNIAVDVVPPAGGGNGTFSFLDLTDGYDNLNALMAQNDNVGLLSYTFAYVKGAGAVKDLYMGQILGSPGNYWINSELDIGHAAMSGGGVSFALSYNPIPAYAEIRFNVISKSILFTPASGVTVDNVDFTLNMLYNNSLKFTYSYKTETPVTPDPPAPPDPEPEPDPDPEPEPEPDPEPEPIPVPPVVPPPPTPEVPSPDIPGGAEAGGDSGGSEPSGDAGGDGGAFSGEGGGAGDGMFGYIYRRDDEEGVVDAATLSKTAVVSERERDAPDTIEDGMIRSAQAVAVFELTRDMEELVDRVVDNRVALEKALARLEEEYLLRPRSDWRDESGYFKGLFDSGNLELRGLIAVISHMRLRMDELGSLPAQRIDGMLIESVRELAESAGRRSGETDALARAIARVADVLREARERGDAAPRTAELAAAFSETHASSLAAWQTQLSRMDAMGRELARAVKQAGER